MTLQAGYEPLLEAIRDADIPCLDRLLSSKKFSVNTEIPYQSEDGKQYIITPLYWAVKLEQPNICRYLLLNNADPYRHMVYEYYPLHEACNRGNKHIVQEFIWSGCDLNHPNSDGDTPLHIACMRGHVDCIRLLLSAGVDRTVRNSKDETPLQTAQFTNQTDLYKLFEVFDKGSSASSLLHHTRLHRPLSSDYSRYGRPSTHYYSCMNGSHDDTLLRDTRYSRHRPEQVLRTNSFSGSDIRRYSSSYNSSSLTRPHNTHHHHVKKSSLLSQQQSLHPTNRNRKPSLVSLSQQHDSQLIFPTQNLVSDPRRTQTCHDFGKDIPRTIEDHLYPTTTTTTTTNTASTTRSQQHYRSKILSPTDEVESDCVSSSYDHSQGGGPKLRVHHMVQYLNQAVKQKYGGSGFDTAYLPLLTSIHSDLNFSPQEFESLQNLTGEFCDKRLPPSDRQGGSSHKEGVELVWGCDYDIIDYNPLHVILGTPTSNYSEMLFKVRLHPQELSHQTDDSALLKVITDITNTQVKEDEEREEYYQQSAATTTTTTCTELQIINCFPPHPNLLQILHYCQAHSRPFERFTKLFSSDGQNSTCLKMSPRVHLIFLNDKNCTSLFENYISSRRHVHSRPPYGIEERTALMFLAQLFLALAHLDQYGIIVTHLMPSDILFDSRHHLILTGLSHALNINNSKDELTNKYESIRTRLQNMSLNTCLGFSPELSYLRDSSSLPSHVPSLVSYLQSTNSYTGARLFRNVFTTHREETLSEVLYEEPPELKCFSPQLRNLVNKILTLTYEDRPSSFQAALCCFILLFGPSIDHCGTLSDCQQWLVTETCHFFLRPSLKGQPSTYSSDDPHTKLLFIYLLIVTPEALYAATKLVYESAIDNR